MSLGKTFGGGLLAIFVLGWLTQDDETAVSAHTPSWVAPDQTPSATPPKPAPSDPTQLALPLPKDKEDALATLPKPAAFTPPRPAETAPKPAPSQTVFVSGSRVNVRASPDIAQNVVGQFSKGDKLTATETRGGWTRVSGTRSGRQLSGWMSGKYLSRTRPKPVATAAAPPKRAVAVPSSSEVTKARQAIIRQSLAGYPGNCPCPYNRDRAGRSCGKRSAWSKPGGYSPICYDSDVSRSRLVSYFARLGKQYR